MASCLICTKSHAGSAWQINSWHTDPVEAERRAVELVTAPHMDVASSVFDVGGVDALPTFTLRFTSAGTEGMT